MAFTNPVIPGFNPDPTVCVVPASSTEPTTFFLSTSTFELFPGCAIYSSTDLLNWRLIGHALTRRSQVEMRTVEPGAGSWASTLRYRQEEKRWYLANGLFQRYRPTADVSIVQATSLSQHLHIVNCFQGTYLPSWILRVDR